MDKEAQRQIQAANEAVENSNAGAVNEPVLFLNAPLGTVVQMRSGGPLMTIVGGGEGEATICQFWSEPQGTFMTEQFHEDLLIAWWNPDIQKSVETLLKTRETDRRWRTNSRS